MKKRSIILLIIFIHAIYLPASAQRTMSGQFSLRLSALYTGPSVCAEAFLSGYTLNGYWQAGVEAKDYDALLSTGNNLDYVHTLASGGYMYRLAGTRGRRMNLYAGGDILFGAELCDPFRIIPAYIDTGLSRVHFLYGVSPKLSVEFFPWKRMAFTLDGAIPVCFSSQIRSVHFEAGIGVKVML